MTENQAKRAYQFFNCDEAKTIASMNPYYNSTIFRDYKASRNQLWKTVKEAIYVNKQVVVDNEKMEEVKEAILNGNPTDVNDILKYGIIVAYEIV